MDATDRCLAHASFITGYDRSGTLLAKMDETCEIYLIGTVGEHSAFSLFLLKINAIFGKLWGSNSTLSRDQLEFYHLWQTFRLESRVYNEETETAPRNFFEQLTAKQCLFQQYRTLISLAANRGASLQEKEALIFTVKRLAKTVCPTIEQIAKDARQEEGWIQLSVLLSRR